MLRARVDESVTRIESTIHGSRLDAGGGELTQVIDWALAQNERVGSLQNGKHNPREIVVSG